ncbi:MAG TPA: tetratricopeptide repeat protein [Stellaceae bacterium]|jgi:tetratricopeptide (TPR) repeat protein
MRRLSCILVAGLLGLSAAYAGADPPMSPQAGAALAKTLAAVEQRVGPADPQLLPILASLAQLRFEEADIAAATALRRRALRIAIDACGGASEPAANAMAALAHLYIEQRRYLDAEPLAIVADNVLAARRSAEDPVLAPLLADRARIALARGETGEARKLAEAAIAIDDRNLGAPRSDRLRVLGAVLVSQARFADGERLLRRAIALDRAGGDRLATARSLAQLGKAYLRQKQFAKALPPIEEAAAIDQDRLGATHPLIAEDLHDLGLIYLATGRAADAAMAFRAATHLLKHGAGRDTPILAYIELDLARAEHALGHEDKSRSLFDAARRILNQAEDEEHERQRRA